MKKLIIAIPLLLVLSWSCKKNDVAPETPFDSKGYLSGIMDIMQQHAVYRYEIDWADFRKQVLDKGGNATRREATYPAISLALELLKDNGHSTFVTQNGNGIGCNCHVDTTEYYDIPVSHDSTIGYIKIPWFLGTTEESITTYISTIQDSIKEQDKASVKGWIVDLRGNFGGYWGPMLQAVRPILGEGITGYMVSPDGTSYSWDFNISFVENYHLEKPDPKVAVLTDRRTASAGELITIAFKDRPHTRSFGTATYGVSTGRTEFGYYGERVVLATEIMADRNMKLYGKEVYPDEEESDATLMVEKAVEWIKR